MKMPDGTLRDFAYVSHEIREGSVPMETLLSAYGGDQTLVVTLRDTTVDATLTLYYNFLHCNVITRQAVLQMKAQNRW